MASGLTEFVRAGAAARFDWKTLNCWFWVADWIALRTGIDPAADLRGKFTNRFGAIRLVMKRNAYSYLDLADEAARRWGFAEIPADSAQPGDVGAIATPAGNWGLICLGKRWAAKIDPGIWIGLISPNEITRAWKIDGPRTDTALDRRGAGDCCGSYDR